jgi:hypothetical protein
MPMPSVHKPHRHARDVGEREEVPRRFLEARGDGAEALQAVEEALNEVTLAVEFTRLR